MNKIRAQLVPPPPAPEPSRILADLEVKIDKAQNDLARLQKVVVTKQAELHQADERANCKAKEVRELHAEMMRVKKEVIQVAPPSPPPTTPPKIPVVLLTGDDGGGDDCEITPMAQDDDAFLGLHHGAFEVHDMEDENDGIPEDDCSAQVKRVKVTPSLTFEQTCEFIGSGHFTSDQLAEITQIASMRSDSMSQVTVTPLVRVVTNKKKRLKQPLFKKEAVFEATNKLKEKKESLSCFGQVPQGTKMPLFQVPSSSASDVFTGVNDSANGDTQHKDQNLFFKSCLEEDPLFAHQVQSLERMLRVRDKLASGVLPGICAGSTSAVETDSQDVCAGSSAAGLGLHELEGSVHVSSGALVGSARAGGSLHELEGSVHVSSGALVGSALAGGSLHDLEGFVPENDGLLVIQSCDASTEGDFPALATAGDSEEIIGLLERSVTQSSCLNSDNSSMGVACVDPASAAVAPPAPVSSSPCARVASAAGAVHARRTVSPMHDVFAHNSWSDMVRNSCCTGGLLPVCKSTSYNLEAGSRGPRGRKRSKGVVSGPAEDLRPVSEVEAGVNFRPAGGVREQVAGSLPRRQPGTGSRQVREGVVTPSLHPEVSGFHFVSPGRGLDIRQSMGWTKVCETARSGIWVLKGNARTRMLPENLDHLGVKWIPRGSYKTAWVTPGHDCL